MTRKQERHPRLTPLRALELLRMLERDGARLLPCQLESVKDALASHITAELTRRNKRRRRGAR